MTFSPKRPCKKAGCSELLGVGEGTYCPKHRTEPAINRRQHDEHRGSAASRGYGAEWQKARKRFLGLHPLCVGFKRKHTALATVVDHIVPHKGDQELFWDENNWQPLCKRCHDSKTASEDRQVQPRKPDEVAHA